MGGCEVSKEGLSVRIWVIESDGGLEPIMTADESHFCGSVPNVGDTYAKWGLEDVYRFYSVQRRYFIDSIDVDQGWCVIVREIEPASQMEKIVEAWSEETVFFRELEEAERLEEHETLASTPGTLENLVRQREERAKHRPHHGLTGPEMRGLRFMADHPKIKTIDKIPEMGERRTKRLLDKGLVRAVGKTALGVQKWLITAEGRAEIKREDIYRNWVFDR